MRAAGTHSRKTLGKLRFLVAIALVTVTPPLLLLSSDARADDVPDPTTAQARADYAAGATAYDRKDYETAATRFARADERVPNSRALQLAMASVLHGADAALAMNLVERAESRAVDGSLAELARRLRRRFASEAARIRFVVPAGERYRATVDGLEVDTARSRWVSPGKHGVSLRLEAEPASEREVVLAAGASVDVKAPPPESGGAGLGSPITTSPSPSSATAPMSANTTAPGATMADTSRPPDARRSSGISPIFFWSGVVVSAVAVGTATVLTVDSIKRHDKFVADPQATTARNGEAAQTRAQIAWGAAGGLAAVTVVLGLLTNFHGDGDSRAVSLAVGPSSIALSGQFR